MVQQQNLSDEVERLLDIAAGSRLNLLISAAPARKRMLKPAAVAQHIDCGRAGDHVERRVELRLRKRKS